MGVLGRITLSKGVVLTSIIIYISKTITKTKQPVRLH